MLKLEVSDEIYQRARTYRFTLRFVCGGRVQEVWEHLLRSCRSPETVHYIKGNLEINRRKYNHLDNSKSVSSINLSVRGDGGEREELLLERSRLVSKLHEVIAKIDSVKSGLKALEEERRTVHNNEEEYKKIIKQKRQSATLLALYMKQVSGNIAQLNSVVESMKAVDALYKEKEKAIKGEQVYSLGSGVESEGERNLRLSLEKTLNHMLSVLEESGAPGSRQVLRSDILNLLSRLPACSVEKAVIKNIQTQISSIAEMRAKLDLVEEARNLQIQASARAEGGIISSVRGEVDNLYSKHISLNQDLEKAKKSLLLHQKELESTLKSNRENIGNMADLEAELVHARDIAAKEFFVAEVERLKQQLIELEGKKEDQKEMINWVRGAESRIQGMTSLISQLMDYNKQGADKLAGRQTANLELLNSLQGLQERIGACLDAGQDQPAQILKTFLKAPVERFSSTLVENRTESNLIPTPNLSIYRLRSGYPYPGPGENGVNKDGFLVSQNSRQDLCFQVSNLLSHVQQLKEEYKNLSETRKTGDTLSNLLQLADTLKRCKSQQINDFLPLLVETDKMRRDGVEAGNRVENALVEWEEQGSGRIVGTDTELQVEGLSLTHWEQTLRVALAQKK
ncbi:uncharacterized protein LOC111718282 isoform X2 [Eurytemora carolleeae]|uniref:uncharacterized protein LOC111718282 isoform X2 n=1 Tax=Eurytemora carolleeae TaxID=1294199 RepID=UPI000C76B7A5|nr:uncharacterized protein LOC111718282 isoform X2 [Eurytemora carolleeae]|eukprot:XP_023349594.1 uncharacterized protein LOC111718282 isoform X2 [Eurytemora affinis]